MKNEDSCSEGKRWIGAAGAGRLEPPVGGESPPFVLLQDEGALARTVDDVFQLPAVTVEGNTGISQPRWALLKRSRYHNQ